jgi:hypothetical protein
MNLEGHAWGRTKRCIQNFSSECLGKIPVGITMCKWWDDTKKVKSSLWLVKHCAFRVHKILISGKGTYVSDISSLITSQKH